MDGNTKKSPGNINALMFAVINNRVETINLLFDAGADGNTRTSFTSRPFPMFTAGKTRFDFGLKRPKIAYPGIVRLLQKKGCREQHEKQAGKSALMLREKISIPKSRKF